MIRPRSWTYGNLREFAISLSFEPDPEAGCGASLEQSATWGSFAIWVNGLNLCKHQELNNTFEKVNWYLLPLIRWLIGNWDYLLHEERLPNENHGRDAWQSLRHTAYPPPALDEEDADAWEETYHSWWLRHSLLACREGGLFPNIVLRRFRDSIEFSWGPSPIAGKPDHYEFFAAHGYARIDVQLVVDQLEGLLDAATKHLVEEVRDSKQFNKLRSDFEAIRDSQRLTQRLGLMAGFCDDGRSSSQSYTKFVKEFSSQDDESAFDAFFAGEFAPSFIIEAPQVCLMFGSVSPTLSKDDVERIFQFVLRSHGAGDSNVRLKQMARDVPIRSALEQPWDQGYDLAESLHEALGGRLTGGTVVDVEALIKEFDIDVTDIALDDKSIRAIAIVGDEFRPTIAINSRFLYQEQHPRRFTLAHELCHLLHDRTHGARLAMASGPWAPIDIEKRANAFAAMFLMPRELVSSVIRDNSLQVDSIPSVWQLCQMMQVSFSAAVEHLCNLGYINEITRDAMKQQVIESQAP